MSDKLQIRFTTGCYERRRYFHTGDILEECDVFPREVLSLFVQRGLAVVYEKPKPPPKVEPPSVVESAELPPAEENTMRDFTPRKKHK